MDTITNNQTFATLYAISNNNEVLTSSTAPLSSLSITQVAEVTKQLYQHLNKNKLSSKHSHSLYFTISQNDQVKYKLSSQDPRIERILWYFQNYPIELTSNPKLNVLMTIKEDSPTLLKREDLIKIIEEHNSYPEDWIYPEQFEYDPSKGPAVIWLIHDDCMVYFDYIVIPKEHLEEAKDYIIYQNNGLTIIEDC